MSRMIEEVIESLRCDSEVVFRERVVLAEMLDPSHDGRNLTQRDLDMIRAYLPDGADDAVERVMELSAEVEPGGDVRAMLISRLGAVVSDDATGDDEEETVIDMRSAFASRPAEEDVVGHHAPEMVDGPAMDEGAGSADEEAQADGFEPEPGDELARLAAALEEDGAGPIEEDADNQQAAQQANPFDNATAAEIMAGMVAGAFAGLARMPGELVRAFRPSEAFAEGTGHDGDQRAWIADRKAALKAEMRRSEQEYTEAVESLLQDPVIGADLSALDTMPGEDRVRAVNRINAHINDDAEAREKVARAERSMSRWTESAANAAYMAQNKGDVAEIAGSGARMKRMSDKVAPVQTASGESLAELSRRMLKMVLDLIKRLVMGSRAAETAQTEQQQQVETETTASQGPARSRVRGGPGAGM